MRRSPIGAAELSGTPVALFRDRIDRRRWLVAVGLTALVAARVSGIPRSTLRRAILGDARHGPRVPFR